MELTFFDQATFVAYLIIVIGVSLFKSRKQSSSEDYFLAGRKLTWWLIGISLIAANISTEHFVGMSGQGFTMGLAIASYEWIAAITMVFVALVLLPRFLKCGIYTIPEFLEYRYSPAPRAIMAFYMMVAYVVVALAAVLYSSALALTTIFDFNLTHVVWAIGILAGLYTVWGGLKAVVWADLLHGIALLTGGVILTVVGFNAVGGVGSFFEHNADKLHTLLPADHPDMPWTIMLGGIWIPNIFYWGLNQFITQKTLGASSVKQGQRGVLFAACIKLIIPFIIIFPGIMAYQLFANEIAKGDQAYPYLMKMLLPSGLLGIMLAALFGAVMSSVDSMLNSASTIFTIDLYKQHINKTATPKSLIVMGRCATVVFVIIACLWAPQLGSFGEGIFMYIQKFWGFISPGVCTVFLFGLLVKRAPSIAASGALLLNVPIYGALIYFFPDMAFLNAMVITVGCLVAYMIVMTVLQPLTEPKVLPVQEGMDVSTDASIKIFGAIVIALTVFLYYYFR